MRETSLVLFLFFFVLLCFIRQAHCVDYTPTIKTEVIRFHQGLQYEAHVVEKLLKKFEKDKQKGLLEWLRNIFSPPKVQEEGKEYYPGYSLCAFWKCDEGRYLKWSQNGINVCCYDVKSPIISYHKRTLGEIKLIHEDKDTPFNTLKGQIDSDKATDLEPSRLKCFLLLHVDSKAREFVCNRCHNSNSEWYISYIAYIGREDSKSREP